MTARETTKGGAKKSARPSRKGATSKRATAKKPAAKRKAAGGGARRRASTASAPAMDRRGVITHTELASTDPAATQRWCETVLGWKFMEPMPAPTGPYHMWQFAMGTGGGIRANNPPEGPGSIPYCEFDGIHATVAAALAAGASEMLGPMALSSGMGWIAIVAAPGGAPIGFWSQK